MKAFPRVNAWYSLVGKFTAQVRARWGEPDAPIEASTGETSNFDTKPTVKKEKVVEPFCCQEPIEKVVDTKNLSEVEKINYNLEDQNWLGGQLPSKLDCEKFEALAGNVPSVEKLPNAFNWYILISKFTPEVRASW